MDVHNITPYSTSWTYQLLRRSKIKKFAVGGSGSLSQSPVQFENPLPRLPVNFPYVQGSEDIYHSVPDNNEYQLPSTLNQSPLYDGAVISREEAINCVFDIQKTHNLSNVVMEKIVKTFNLILPPGHQFPPSRFLLLKELSINDVELQTHYFCQSHKNYLGVLAQDVCSDCSDQGTREKLSLFYTMSVRDMVKTLLENETVQRLISKKEQPGHLKIQHGAFFRERAFLKSDVTLTAHIDGVPMKKVSKQSSLWAVSFVINELPASHRFHFRRVAVIAVGGKKPDANVIVKPFIEECAKLSEHGLQWTSRTSGVVTTSNVYLTNCVADAPAKCDSQGLRQWNSKEYGCTTCLVSGASVSVDGLGKRKKVTKVVYPYKIGEDAPYRTLAQTIAASTKVMQELSEGKRTISVEGVKSASEFLLLCMYGFDIIRCFNHDLMHIVIGAGSELLSLMIDVDVKDFPYGRIAAVRQTIGPKRRRLISPSELAILSTAMLSMCYPAHMNRIPCPLQFFKEYKASETLNFFLYSVPFLFQRRDDDCDSILDPPIRSLISTFSIILHLLLADRYPLEEDPSQVIRQRAALIDTMVKSFLHMFTIHFGDVQVKYNFHQLLHLAGNYQDFGPAYETCAFPHEDALRSLKNNQHGTRRIDKEVCNRQLQRQAIAGRLSAERYGVDRPGITFQGAAMKKSVLDRASTEALESILETRPSATVRVYKKGTLQCGLQVETIDCIHEAARNNSAYRLRSGKIVEILHLVDVKTRAGSEFFVLVKTTNSQRLTNYWKPLHNPPVSIPLRLEYPETYAARFHETTRRAVFAAPANLLEMPVLTLDNSERFSVRYICPTFRMATD